jgi:hypothetical protein
MGGQGEIMAGIGTLLLLVANLIPILTLERRRIPELSKP